MTGTNLFLMQKKILLGFAKPVIQPDAIVRAHNMKIHQNIEYHRKNCFAPSLMDKRVLVRQPVTKGDVFKPLRKQGEIKWMIRYLRRQQ